MLLQLKPTETSKFPSARDGLGIIDRYRSSRTRENINLKGLDDYTLDTTTFIQRKKKRDQKLL
jgi:hypothetical protein